MENSIHLSDWVLHPTMLVTTLIHFSLRLNFSFSLQILFFLSSVVTFEWNATQNSFSLLFWMFLWEFLIKSLPPRVILWASWSELFSSCFFLLHYFRHRNVLNELSYLTFFSSFTFSPLFLFRLFSCSVFFNFFLLKTPEVISMCFWLPN